VHNRFLGKIGLFLFIGLLIMPMLASTEPGPLYRDQVAVLAYHHLSDTDKSNVTISPALFRSQLEYLRQKNYHFISLRQFRHFLRGGSVPDNAVLVTFDDGYESFYQYGYPILKELNIPAVNFVITGDLDHPLDSNLPSLSKEMIREMTGEPNFIDVQCHSDALHAKRNNTEPLLTSLIPVNGRLETPEEHDRRISRDTAVCREKLEEINARPVEFYAYPFGDYDADSSRAIQQAGIRYAFTVTSEMATRDDDPMQLPRITGGNPSITPEELDRTIRRKVVDLNRAFGYIPLRDGVAQIGGTLLKTGDGNISFNYHDKQWIVHTDTLTITRDGRRLPLQKPLEVRNRRLYIDFTDLERVMQVHIVYNPLNQTFYERMTPTRIPLPFLDEDSPDPDGEV